jgi:hypothetical protein
MAGGFSWRNQTIQTAKNAKYAKNFIEKRPGCSSLGDLGVLAVQ